MGINKDKKMGQTFLKLLKKKEVKSAVDVKYHEIYQREKDPAWLREKVVIFAQKEGIKKASREFGCSKNTVKLWLKRITEPSNIRFHNKSRIPKVIVQKTHPVLEKQVLEYWEKEHMGSCNLKHQYGLPVSESTVYRILKRNNKINTRKRKYKRSKDLHAIKAKYKCFEVVQVDAKVLNDIVELYPYYCKYSLPLWQFTFTCEKSGATFYSYCQSENALAACTFIVYVLEHLKRYGIKVRKVKTDQGSFAVGRKSLKHSQFQRLLLNIYNVKHQAAYHKNQMSDVERFHGLIEQYFYSIAHIQNKQDFYTQATKKQLWFNFIRKNSGKNWKTPLEIFKKDFPHKDPQVLALPPIDLDNHSDLYLYKLDPNYKPLTKTDFFQDVPDYLLDRLSNPHIKDDFEYFFGIASNSNLLKGGQHVMKLDAPVS